MNSQERYIERAAIAAVRKRWPKVELIKMREPGWPDRMVILGQGRHLYVEFKTKSGKLTPRQSAVHQWLRSLGEPVYVCTTTQEVLAAIAKEK
jgi:hypothetical protein